MDPSANSPPVPRFVFVAYYPEGPHAGPITIGLYVLLLAGLGFAAWRRVSERRRADL